MEQGNIIHATLQYFYQDITSQDKDKQNKNTTQHVLDTTIPKQTQIT
jgi:hypothetical protein